MAPPRTAAGHTAERLRVQLVSKMRTVKDNPKLSKQFCKAIKLCDGFLHRCDNSERGLEILKEQVKTCITSSLATSGPKPVKPKVAVAKREESRPETSLGDTNELWTLPIHKIEMMAKQNSNNAYGQIAVQADKQTVREKLDSKSKIKEEQKFIKKHLEEQMAVKAELRKRESAEKLREGNEITIKVLEYQKEEEVKALAIYERAIVAKKEREQQIRDKRKKLAAERAQQLEEDQTFLRRVTLENDDIKRKKEKKQRDYRNQMQKVQQENLEKLRQKEVARLREQDKEMKLMLEYDAMLADRAARREAEIKAHQEKILAKYKAGGGESLQTNLKMKEREDEERALRVQREADIKMKLIERQNKKKKNREKNELLSSLQAQVQHIELERRKEEEERVAYAEDMRRTLDEEKRKQKAKDVALKEKNRRYRNDIISQMKKDAEKRYQDAADEMPENEKQLNIRLLQGKTSFKIV